jgi:hypothetical protein
VVLRLDSSPEAETLVTLKELAKKLF